MQRGTKVVIALVVAASLFAVVTFAVMGTLRDAFQRRYLVLRATDVLSTDAPDGAVPADLGPHCAPALWAQSGALIVDSDLIPADATAVLYVEYRTDRVFPTTGGGVAVFFFRGAGPMLDVHSAVDNATVLFTLEDRNSTMVQGGTEYAAGQAFQGTYTVPVTIGADTWHVTERYTVTSLGVAAVTVQPPTPCA